MPLRDHFHPPLDDRHSWDEVHGQWPAMVVLQLFPLLPEGYEAAPRVHLGKTAVEAPPKPSLTVETELPAQDEYEVRVYNAKRGRRLVAAIEFVSPANKDRPENRAAFAAKCLSLLQQQVSVSIVDLVPVRDFNLYVELLTLMRRSHPSLGSPPPSLYAVTCRTRNAGGVNLFDAWTYPLAVGQPLPRLPLWLADDLMIYLDLEESYQDTCRVLRIP